MPVLEHLDLQHNHLLNVGCEVVTNLMHCNNQLKCAPRKDSCRCALFQLSGATLLGCHPNFLGAVLQVPELEHQLY